MTKCPARGHHGETLPVQVLKPEWRGSTYRSQGPGGPHLCLEFLRDPELPLAVSISHHPAEHTTVLNQWPSRSRGRKGGPAPQPCKWRKLVETSRHQ